MIHPPKKINVHVNITTPRYNNRFELIKGPMSTNSLMQQPHMMAVLINPVKHAREFLVQFSSSRQLGSNCFVIDLGQPKSVAPWSGCSVPD